ncbi:hypothetical protein [Rhodanobacter sp. OR444]|uniref:hypothetical protein n=1 Tax=Rhodanobacter sp. OR444 TaxID=1076525 RepID=UPI00163B2B4D|nr:hypothetical protein [Rhodanobacter sp. OR444]
MSNTLNGIDLTALQQFAESVAHSPAKGDARFNVKTKWQHQARTAVFVNEVVRSIMQPDGRVRLR